MTIRLPSLEDYRSHSGLHYRQLWLATPDTWSCPGCGRSKFQIMRWTRRFPKSPNSFEGWVAALHRHHDHSVPLLSAGIPRFPETVVCDQCNAADGVSKRELRLPRYFSFSPAEIRSFVIAEPHGKHRVNLEIARLTYANLQAQRFPGFWPE